MTLANMTQTELYRLGWASTKSTHKLMKVAKKSRITLCKSEAIDVPPLDSETIERVWMRNWRPGENQGSAKADFEPR